MWKREEPPRTKAGDTLIGSEAKIVSTPEDESLHSSSRSLSNDVINIGKSVIIKGELSGSENLTIEGMVEGEIKLPDHVLTIGPNGKIKARVEANSVVVMGNVVGNIGATDKISIRENGTVEGDLSAPIVSISEGAQFRGSIDMQRSEVLQQTGVGNGVKAKSQASEKRSSSDSSTSQKTSSSGSPAQRAPATH